MNRPQIRNYLESPYKVHNEYVRELEKYCNELEKALDKACEMLQNNEEAMTLDNSYHSAEQWKEWLLNEKI